MYSKSASIAMTNIAVLFYIIAVTHINAMSWIYIRDTSAEGGDDIPSHTYCLVRFYVCESQLTVKPRLPEFNSTGIHVTRANVDNICSVGAEFVPCIETDRPGKKVKCHGTERARRLRKMYDFMCVNNKTDMYNLVPCVNDMRVQWAVFGCTSKYHGQIEMLRYAHQQVPLGEENQYLLCTSLYEVKQCISRKVQAFCGDRDAAVIDNLMDVFPMVFSILFDYEYDVTYCDNIQP